MKNDEEQERLIIWSLSILCLVLLAALLLVTSLLLFPREPGNRASHHEPSSSTPKRLSKPISGETMPTKNVSSRSEWIWSTISSPYLKSLEGPNGQTTVWTR